MSNIIIYYFISLPVTSSECIDDQVSTILDIRALVISRFLQEDEDSRQQDPTLHVLLSQSSVHVEGMPNYNPLPCIEKHNTRDTTFESASSSAGSVDNLLETQKQWRQIVPSRFKHFPALLETGVDVLVPYDDIRSAHLHVCYPAPSAAALTVTVALLHLD